MVSKTTQDFVDSLSDSDVHDMLAVQLKRVKTDALYQARSLHDLLVINLKIAGEKEKAEAITAIFGSIAQR